MIQTKDKTSDECTDCDSYQRGLKAIAAVLIIAAICMAVAVLWVYYLRPKYLESKKPKVNVVRLPAPRPIDWEIPDPVPIVMKRDDIEIALDDMRSRSDCGYKAKCREEEKEELDALKIGIYSKKEATREYRWFKSLNSMDVLIPNLTKKLKKSAIKSAPTYTEIEIIKKGKMLMNGLSSFGVPGYMVRSAKVIGFTESRILIPFAIDGKPEFGLIIPVSEGLKLKVESDAEEPILEQSKDLDEPTLFRADEAILIEQTENAPKQFILFHLDDPSFAIVNQ